MQQLATTQDYEKKNGATRKIGCVLDFLGKATTSTTTSSSGGTFDHLIDQINIGEVTLTSCLINDFELILIDPYVSSTHLSM